MGYDFHNFSLHHRDKHHQLIHFAVPSPQKASVPWSWRLPGCFPSKAFNGAPIYLSIYLSNSYSVCHHSWWNLGWVPLKCPSFLAWIRYTSPVLWWNHHRNHHEFLRDPMNITPPAAPPTVASPRPATNSAPVGKPRGGWRHLGCAQTMGEMVISPRNSWWFHQWP